MGRPSKPLALVRGHRTNAEKKVREQAEKSLLSGDSFREIPEVKGDPVAHKQFQRLKKIYKAIGKDDALHETTLNRYCLLHSECKRLEGILSRVDMLNDVDTYLIYDKQLMTKRKMMFDIERESLMTLASALRSIPKKPDENKGKSAMASFLERKKNAT
jgi:DNA-directed RNA polymerase subunit N (RpoN/RPB10)